MRRRITVGLVAACAVLTAYAPVAGASDGDPLPANVEMVLCGFPQLVSLLDALPSVAGRCVDTGAPTGADDYQSPVFDPPSCTDCTTTTAANLVNVPLTQAVDSGPVELPPITIPGQETPPTPPVDQPVGTIEGVQQPDGQRYCLYATPEDRAPVFECADLGPIGALMPSFGPTELVQVGSVDPPDTPAIDHGGVTTVPNQHVAALSYDLLVESRSVNTRLNELLGPGAVTVYDPVDLDDATARQWWVDNGDQTSVHVRLVLRQDGTPIQTVDISVPYLGQILAALSKSGIFT